MTTISKVSFLLLAIFFLTPEVKGQGTRIFYDGFESGNTSKWQQYIGRGMPTVTGIALDGGAGPHSGSKMLRANWDGQVAWNDPGSYETMVLRPNTLPMGSEILVRFWVRYDSDVDNKNGAKLFRLGNNLVQTFAGAFPTSGISFAAFTNSPLKQLGTTYWGGGEPIRNGQWHKMEIYVKVSSTAGIVRLWFDSSKKWEATGVNSVDADPWNEFLLMSNWSTGDHGGENWDHDANNHVYWDEIEIFTDASSGEPATGSMNDGTIKVSGITNVACSAPGIVFCNGFEETNWRATWDDYDGNPSPDNTVITNPGPFNIAGNQVMRFRVPAGRGGVDLVKVLPGTYDKLYARWYQLWEPGYNFNAPNHGSTLHAGSRNYLGQSDNRPTGNDFASSGFEPQVGGNYSGVPALYTYYRGMYQDCANPVGSCWGDHYPCFVGSNYCTNAVHNPPPMPPKLQTGKWYCIEVMIDMGSPVSNGSNADGVLNFWIDGVAYGPWNNMWFRTDAGLKLSILMLSLFHHDATHSVEGVLFDEVIVSTSPIGCSLATGNVHNLSPQQDIRIYPNPFNESTTIDFTGLQRFQSDNLSFKLSNTLGKEVLTYSNITDNKILLRKEDLAPGIYLYKILLSGQYITAGKIIVD